MKVVFLNVDMSALLGNFDANDFFNELVTDRDRDYYATACGVKSMCVPALVGTYIDNHASEHRGDVYGLLNWLRCYTEW